MKTLGHLSVLSLLALSLVACADLSEALKNAADKEKVKPQVDTKALVQDDLRLMRDAPGTSRVPTTDVRKLRLFTHVFSGETGRHVRDYVDQRINYYFNDEDMSGLQMSPQPRNTGYATNPNAPAAALLGAAPLAGEAVTAAANIGAAVFLQGAIDQNTISLILPAVNKTIPVSSTRTGLMLIGPGYIREGQNDEGKTFELPTEYRQATLVHEARHSDCTGGVSQAALNVARNSRNIIEFVNNYPAMNCGHLHTMCPAWHEFKDLPACDRHFWGAYAVGYVFAAAKQDPNSTGFRDVLLRYMENDSASRLLYLTKGTNRIIDVEPMLNGQWSIRSSRHDKLGNRRLSLV